MSTPPIIPRRYAKRPNDFSSGQHAPAADGTGHAGRVNVEDEGAPVQHSSTWNFTGDMVRVLANTATGATDVLIDFAIPSRPVESEPPTSTVVLTATGGIATIAVRWTDAPNAESFVLYRGTATGGPYTEIVDALALGYDDADVEVGTEYFYIVIPVNRYGEGPQSNEDSAELGGAAASLNGLRWELPNTGPGSNPESCTCPMTDSDSTTMGGTLGQTYLVTLNFWGVAEEKTYTGGTQDGHWNEGGTPDGGTYNIYSLTTSNPAATYYLNDGTSGQSRCYEIGITKTIPIVGGATVDLLASSIEGQEVRNRDGGGTPITVRGETYDGQFIQMDIVAIDGGDPAEDETSEIVYPEIENRLQHSSLETLRWKDAGHSASGQRIAGFDMAGDAKEYGLTTGGQGGAILKTEGIGRAAYEALPVMVESQVVAAELFGDDDEDGGL